MLTRGDIRFNSLLMRFLSVLKIYPVYIDSGALRVQRSPRKRWICFALFGITFLHGCYIHLRLLQVLLNQIESARHHLVFHVNLSLTSLMVQGWYIICFLLYPDAFVALFNDILPGHGGTELSEEFPEPRKRCCLQEWLVLGMPMFFVQFVGFLLGLFCYDRSMVFLLYSSLHEDYKNTFWFLLLLCQEAFLLASLGGNAVIVFSTQLLFFEKITNRLKSFNSSLTLLDSRVSEDRGQWGYAKLREIQLKVSLFNDINRNIVLSFKIFCITSTTLCGYYMIAYFSERPIFGCIYYFLFGMQFMLYTVTYEKAFTIPEMVSLIKSTVLLRAVDSVHVPGHMRMMRMRMRSVPEVGIQVGRFHTFESVAVLLYVDYVLRNVVGLHVMHSGN